MRGREGGREDGREGGWISEREGRGWRVSRFEAKDGGREGRRKGGWAGRIH